MSISQTNSKITESHLSRRAIVYLRQSSDKQVKNNIESQRLQYALQDRAKEWGWKYIEVIDCDLGASAAIGARARVGFDKTISSVAMREVGIIFNRETSRLSRTDKDWCSLLEVCGLFDTLISDGEKIYDCNCTDDQIMLGIKGVLNVAEYNTLRKRMIECMEAKAKRGEYKKQLPPGFIWDESGKIVKEPNKRVQEVINLVFKKFREIQSVRQTFLWFHSEEIELPVTKEKDGKKTIAWGLPQKGHIKDILENACYAGVYVWGRDATVKDYVDGKIVKRRKRIKNARDSKVFIENNHEGYIDLDTYEEIQKMISGNCLSQMKGTRVGAVRGGQGLLGGILRCGRCGRKLSVSYYGKSGTAARYVCRGDYESGGNYCLAFGGSTVNKVFSKELLRIISPYGMEASIYAVNRASIEEDEKDKVIKQKVQQLEYEATRAFEQYDEVDPRNRLVAAELEKRWNEKLEKLENAKSELSKIGKDKCNLTEEEKEEILALGERFEDVWESEHCTASLKKKIIRTVIEEVIVNLDETSQMLKFIIHWKGGYHTAFEMPKPASGIGQKTTVDDLDIIRKMANRYGDDDIARVLNKLKRKTATGKRWNEFRVRTIRGKYSISGHINTIMDPELLTLGQAAKYLEVSRTTVKKLVESGILEMKQIVPWAPWEIKKSDLDSDEITAIINRLRERGKLILKGVDSEKQKNFFHNL